MYGFPLFYKAVSIAFAPNRFFLKKLKAFSIIKQHTVYSEMNYVLKYVYYVQTMMQVYRVWWAMKPFITESMEFLNFYDTATTIH